MGCQEWEDFKIEDFRLEFWLEKHILMLGILKGRIMNVDSRISVCIIFIVLYCAGAGLCETDDKGGNDWDGIWLTTLSDMPEPTVVEIGDLGELGEELENRQWQMVATEYHQIHYQPSADKAKVAKIYSRIDNLYRFLGERSPMAAQTPIRVFLVPDEVGHSRCDRISNSMRTGDRGDEFFMLTSLLHEETHLFNFAFLGSIPQGWWAGEFSCQYYQQRALWEGQGKRVKWEIENLLPNGPSCRFSEIGGIGREAFDEAISVLYFLEEQYGREKSIELRKALLAEAQKTMGESVCNSVFEEVFGKGIGQLEREWLRFYGWRSFKSTARSKVSDVRLTKRISYSVDKASVQNIVKAMAEKADLKYDFTKSQSNTGELCRRWVYNVDVKDKPLDEAIKGILEPFGLTYKLEADAIVLYKKETTSQTGPKLL